MSLQKIIKKILKEEKSFDDKKIVKDLLDEVGFDRTIKYLGGLSNFIDMMYDGDLLKFSEGTITPIVYESLDRMNLYFHDEFAKRLGLKDIKVDNEIHRNLGYFKVVVAGERFTFKIVLTPTMIHNQPYGKVKSSDGDYGFSKLGENYRQQIFQQIIDKYDLKPYMNVKTFY